MQKMAPDTVVVVDYTAVVDCTAAVVDTAVVDTAVVDIAVVDIAVAVVVVAVDTVGFDCIAVAAGKPKG